MAKRVNIEIDEKSHSQAKIISILKRMPLGVYLTTCLEGSIDEDKGLIDQVKRNLSI